MRELLCVLMVDSLDTISSIYRNPDVWVPFRRIFELSYVDLSQDSSFAGENCVRPSTHELLPTNQNKQLCRTCVERSAVSLRKDNSGLGCSWLFVCPSLGSCHSSEVLRNSHSTSYGGPYSPFHTHEQRSNERQPSTKQERTH